MTYRLKTLECPCCRTKLDLKLEFDLLTVEPTKDEPWRETKIEDMEISIRAMNVLRNSWLDCRTAGDIDALSDGIILRAPGVGRRTLKEVRQAVGALRDRG